MILEDRRWHAHQWRIDKFSKGGGAEKNVSARSSFIANAHNIVYAFYTGKSDFYKNAEAISGGVPPPFESVTGALLGLWARRWYKPQSVTHDQFDSRTTVTFILSEHSTSIKLYISVYLHIASETAFINEQIRSWYYSAVHSHCGVISLVFWYMLFVIWSVMTPSLFGDRDVFTWALSRDVPRHRSWVRTEPDTFWPSVSVLCLLYTIERRYIV